MHFLKSNVMNIRRKRAG